MIRTTATVTTTALALALAVAAGPAAAGEDMDCYNDKVDADSRYTSNTPEELRITDAEIDKMLADIRAHEQRAAMLAQADADKSAAD